jgi:hypothetical protein
MSMAAPMIDPALLRMFDVVRASDPEKLSGQFRVFARKGLSQARQRLMRR